MKRKCMVMSSLVIFFICSFEVVVSAEGSPSRRQVPKDWPGRFGKRKLHCCEYGFVYAGKKSGADQAKKILRTVVKDLRQDGVTKPAEGLILVMDSKEKPPFEVTKLIEAVSMADAQKSGEKSQDTLEAIAETKKDLEKQGLGMDTLLSLVPVPIPPATLHQIAKEFPENADRQVGYCIIIPTDRCVKAGMKKMIDAMLKKEKVSLAKRLAVLAIMRLAEQKIAKQMKKESQAVLYQLLLDAQKELLEEQKEKMAKAYRQKLGLENRPKVDDKKKDKDGIEAEQKEKHDLENRQERVLVKPDDFQVCCRDNSLCGPDGRLYASFDR